MIEAITGNIHYSDQLLLGPETPPSAIPAAAIRKSQTWTDKSGHSWQALHLVPPSQDPQLHLTLRFCDAKLFSAEFFANIFQGDKEWASWSEQKELQRKQHHDRLLAQWLGKATDFDWGKIWSTYDSKGGFSTFGVTYRQGT